MSKGLLKEKSKGLSKEIATELMEKAVIEKEPETVQSLVKG